MERFGTSVAAAMPLSPSDNDHPQSIHGFDRTLKLVATRREDYDMDDIMEVDLDDTHS